MHDGYWRNGPVLNNAVSAVEMALWDIKGKAAELPCYQLWGGRSRGTAAVYVHANGNEPGEVLDQALGYWERGFRQHPLPARRLRRGRSRNGQQRGRRILRRRRARFAVLRSGREAAPRAGAVRDGARRPCRQEAELLYDIHERLPPVDAVRLAKALEPYRLFFLEDALAPEDLGYFHMLRAQCAVPLAMGELFVHPLEVEPLVTGRLIDFVRVHVSTYGGITAALKLANLCAGVRGTHRLARPARRCRRSAWPPTCTWTCTWPTSASRSGPSAPPAEEDLFPGIPEVRAGAVDVNEQPRLGYRDGREAWRPASRATMPPACAPSRVSPTAPAVRSERQPPRSQAEISVGSRAAVRSQGPRRLISTSSGSAIPLASTCSRRCHSISPGR